MCVCANKGVLQEPATLVGTESYLWEQFSTNTCTCTHMYTNVHCTYAYCICYMYVERDTMYCILIVTKSQLIDHFLVCVNFYAHLW